MGNFTSRIYYKLSMVLASPLSVGSGGSVSTDHDVFVDNTGSPVIPAATIAGVMRSYIAENFGSEKAVNIFGDIEDKNNKSRIRVYDALCNNSEKPYFISNRDCVKLADKVNVKGAKFDFQVVETGTEFESYIELLDESCSDTVEKALAALNAGYFGFGAKVTRGFGRVNLTVEKKSFSDVLEWLDFKMFREECWDNSELLNMTFEPSNKLAINIELQSKGGISIREYSTDINMPDYKTLSLKRRTDEGGLQPVIPGTSWAGAFRERCSRLLSEGEIISYFGFVNEKTSVSERSRIIFFESILENGCVKDITRNSIDRFSGAAKAKSLYTEESYFNGKTYLKIFCPRDKRLLSALAVCIADLHNGFLAVGGLTSIGRGLFTVKSICVNGEPIKSSITTDNPDINGFTEEALSK